MHRTRRFAVVEDPRYQEHAGPSGHPDCPERLAAVGQALDGVREGLVALPSRPADDGELLRVHTAGHLEALREATGAAPLQLDPDTYLSPRSLEVARLAAGGCIDLSRAVLRGQVDAGLAAVRPPGHHAEGSRAMGFCLFNNVAVAARTLQREEQVDRILVLDWDVHHGNGSQHSFESDPGVLYLSTHQFPHYPGTGAAGEAGVGRGEGATVNVPMPAGCGDAEYLGVFQRVVVPVVESFRPELILVSAGFDAHADDPLAGMGVSGRGFLEMARIVRALADDVCQGRLVFVLEGGYAPTGLREGIQAVLAASLAEQTPPLAKAVDASPGTPLAQVLDRVHAVHGRRIRDLGAA